MGALTVFIKSAGRTKKYWGRSGQQSASGADWQHATITTTVSGTSQVGQFACRCTPVVTCVCR